MEDSRLLGPVIRAWFKSNDWPQSTSEGLARAKGWEIGPWASQISICMAGKLAPKPPFFVALGLFNQAVAERDFIGVTDRRLMDRLKNGQPLCHDNGIPWGAVDFFSCYIGATAAIDAIWKTPEMVLTQEHVDTWADGVRSLFRDLCLTMMAPPVKVWAEVAEELANSLVAPDDISWAQEVIAGLREPTLKEGQRIIQKWGAEQPLIGALMTIHEKYGGDISKIKKFKAWRELLLEPARGQGFPHIEEVRKKGPPRRHFGFDPGRGVGRQQSSLAMRIRMD